MRIGWTTAVPGATVAASPPAGNETWGTHMSRYFTSTVPGVAISVGASGIPSFWISNTTFALQPDATVAAPKAYSRIRSHPMIHAKISPSVAYPYVYAEPAIGISDANSA